MNKSVLAGLVMGILFNVTGVANATLIAVNAKAGPLGGNNSLPPQDTGILVTSGHVLTIIVGDSEKWNQHWGVSWSWYDADGRNVSTHELSGLLTLNGFTAINGSLVGLIGSDYYAIGKDFSGIALSTGTLKLMQWDSDYVDNTGSITADINVSASVPEPATMLLFSTGIAGLAGSKLRRKKGGNAVQPNSGIPGTVYLIPEPRNRQCLNKGNKGARLNYEPREWPNLWLKCERAPRASC